MIEKIEDVPSEAKIRIIGVSAVTPNNKALYEAGKAILSDSINAGRDFCQFMITMSTGAIPIYLALLTFVLPDKYTFSLIRGILAVTPPILFLIASIIFALGYFPRISEFSLDYPHQIEEERKKTINRRNRLSKYGFAVFLSSSLLSIAGIMIYML